MRKCKMILNNKKKKILGISIIIITIIITAVLYSGKNDSVLISPAIEIGEEVGFMSKDIIPKIKCPTLSIYGENDYLVLAEKNAELLEEGLKKGGNNNYEIVVVPQANHGFRVSGKCYKSSDLENSFAPGFINALDSWEYPDYQGSPEIENEYPTE